jgi:hypothetical protein
MAQQPVPVDMLLGEGVLDHLREVIRQLTAYHMPSARNDCLEAPASWIDMATGKLLPDRIHEDMVSKAGLCCHHLPLLPSGQLPCWRLVPLCGARHWVAGGKLL